jgi:hypothetical protein
MRTLCGFCKNIILIKDTHGLNVSSWNAAGYCSVRKSSFVRVGIFEVLYGAEGILLK